MRTLYGHAWMVGMGTLSYGQMGVWYEEPQAMAAAESDASLTSLAVIVFSFTEAHLKDSQVILGGFEEGRELTAQEANDLLARGYAPETGFGGWTLGRLQGQRKHLAAILAVSAGQDDHAELRAEYKDVCSEIAARLRAGGMA